MSVSVLPVRPNAFERTMFVFMLNRHTWLYSLYNAVPTQCILR